MARGVVFRNALSRVIQRSEEEAALPVAAVAGLLERSAVAFPDQAHQTGTALRNAELAGVREVLTCFRRHRVESCSLRCDAIPNIMQAPPEPWVQEIFIRRTQDWQAAPRPSAQCWRQNSRLAAGMTAFDKSGGHHDYEQADPDRHVRIVGLPSDSIWAGGREPRDTRWRGRERAPSS